MPELGPAQLENILFELDAARKTSSYAVEALAIRVIPQLVEQAVRVNDRLVSLEGICRRFIESVKGVVK